MQRNERFPVVRINETIWKRFDATVRRINLRMRFDPMLIEYFVFENAHLACKTPEEQKKTRLLFSSQFELQVRRIGLHICHILRLF